MSSQIRALIQETLDEFFPREGPFAAAFGGCGDFADYLYTNAKEKGVHVEIEGVHMTLSESDCGFTAPVGVTLEQLHSWGVIENLSHVWVIHENRHYDAVTPEGVDDPFQLRLFRQVCIEVLRVVDPVALERLIAEHEWWRESERLTDEFLIWYDSQMSEQA